MTQREFIDKLKVSLSGKVSEGTVNENVVYYEQYFASEKRNGKSEEDICEALGSPNIIAKGILEAEKFQSHHTRYTSYEDGAEETRDYRSTAGRWSRRQGVREFRLPGWLVTIIAIMLFFFTISLVLTVFSALAPIIIPICIVLFIVQIFKNSF